MSKADSYWTLALMSAAMMLEGYDVQVMAYAAPAIIKAWSSSKVEFGAVFGILQFGMLLGGLVFSPFGDKLGGKSVVVVSCLAFGLLTLPIAAATSIGQLIWLRGLAGIALGVTLPIAVAAISYAAPAGKKIRSVGIGYVGYSVGNVGGGLLAAALIPTHGWHSVFLVGGILPSVLAVLLIWRLPSSFAPAKSENAVAIHRWSSAWKVGLLFRDGRAVMTVSLWIALAGAFMATHFLTNWLPAALDGGRPTAARFNTRDLDVHGRWLGRLFGGGALRR